MNIENENESNTDCNISNNVALCQKTLKKRTKHEEKKCDEEGTSNEENFSKNKLNIFL